MSDSPSARRSQDFHYLVSQEASASWEQVVSRLKGRSFVYGPVLLLLAASPAPAYAHRIEAYRSQLASSSSHHVVAVANRSHCSPGQGERRPTGRAASWRLAYRSFQASQIQTCRCFGDRLVHSISSSSSTGELAADSKKRRKSPNAPRTLSKEELVDYIARGEFWQKCEAAEGEGDGHPYGRGDENDDPVYDDCDEVRRKITAFLETR